MNTLNIAQPLPRLTIRVHPVPNAAANRRPVTDHSVQLYRQVQIELRRADQCHTTAFILLSAMGLVATALAFFWPFV